jgi:signal transduction histidine kinase
MNVTQLPRPESRALALVTHELRQPMQRMAMAVSQIKKTDEPTWRRLIDALEQLDTMVSALGDAGMLSSGAFTVRPVLTDLGRIAKAAAERVSLRAVTRSHLPEGFRVCADPRRIGQVVTNLVANAVAHGDHETPILVSLSWFATKEVIVSVCNGGSIPMDVREKMFTPFVKGKQSRGLGLGLHICHQIVSAHGGRLWWEGDATTTCFRFALPTSPYAKHPVKRTVANDWWERGVAHLTEVK